MQHIDLLLSQNIQNKDYVEQVKWLLAVFQWIRMPKDLQNHKISRDKVYSVRLKHLLMLLNRNDVWKSNFTQSISSILIQMSPIKLFTESGLNIHSSFIQESIRRIEEKFIPQAPLTDNLTSLLLELFPDIEENYLVENIDENIFSELINLFQYDTKLLNYLNSIIITSLEVLSVQILANSFNIHRELDFKLDAHKNWPENKLLFAIENHPTTSKKQIDDYIFKTIENLNGFYKLMQNRGIKIDLVYLLESQKRRLERLNLLYNILYSSSPNKLHTRHFLSQLILDIHHQSSLRSFLAENLSLLSKQIVNQNSHLGEHYITYSWVDFLHMYKIAVGGGAFTTITVFLKILISKLAISGFIKGIAEGLNYALSFLSIQALGWTLATKQPSTTAPFLASSLKNSLSEAKTAILAIFRTQFIAVIGNLSLVMPLCFIISLSTKFYELSFLSPDKALMLFNSTNLLGPSFIFAAFTGVLLFASSIIAGWFDNWISIHQIPERIANHQKLISIIGTNLTRKLSVILAKSANPVSANISLGFLLGFMPQYLKFMGLPIEVRHITLSAGSFATALPYLDYAQITSIDFVNSIFGLILIGVINIAVSFSLALILAAVSSQIPLKRLLNLSLWGLQIVLTNPWLLIFPSKEQKSKSI